MVDISQTSSHGTVPQPCEVGNVSLILLKRRLRLREAVWYVQGHTAWVEVVGLQV